MYKNLFIHHFVIHNFRQWFEFCGNNASIFLFADDAKLYKHIMGFGEIARRNSKQVEWADEMASQNQL